MALPQILPGAIGSIGSTPYDPYASAPTWQTVDTLAEQQNSGTRPSSVPLPQATAPQETAAAIGAQSSVYNQLPGYAADLKSIGSNISGEVAGQLPSDVVNQLEQSAAERGVATGTAGSQANNASLLQSLGLNSLYLTGLGQSNLTNILPTLPGASIAGNSSFYVTPQEQYEAQLQNNIFAAMPSSNNQAGALQAAQAGINAGAGGAGAGTFTLPGSPQSTAAQPTANPSYNLSYRNPEQPVPGTGPSTQDWLASIISNYATTASGGQAPQQGWTDQDLQNYGA